MISELAANVLMILARLYLIFLFFTKKRLFPRFFIIVMIASPLIIYLDAYFAARIMNELTAGLGQAAEEILDSDTTKDFIRALVYACIWSPYMLYSKRVKNTFVQPRDETLSRVFQ